MDVGSAFRHVASDDRNVTYVALAFFVAVVAFVGVDNLRTVRTVALDPGSVRQASVATACDAALSAAHESRAAADRVATDNADALQHLVVQFEDADQALARDCLNNSQAVASRYDAALEDADVLLRERVWLGVLQRLEGAPLTDAGGRDPETLRSLAVEQLQSVQLDDTAAWTDRDRAQGLLHAIGS